MRGAPHNGFSRHIRRMRSRTSRETGGRPQRCERDFQVQKRRKPLRCQPITVAGLTIARAPRQSGQKLQIRAQNQRSGGYSRGRGVFRFSTASCWRIAKLSKYEAANVRSSRCRRATRSRMSIFRMAERLSGRWPVSQGFCGVRSFGEPQLLGLYTGARKGSILSLRWHQVDLERGRINFNPGSNRQTTKGKPIIPIPRGLLLFLRQARQRGSELGFVINRHGRQVRDVKRAFSSAVVRAGLEDVTPHTLRHMAGTWMAQHSVPLWEISGYLGHSQEPTTELYSQPPRLSKKCA